MTSVNTKSCFSRGSQRRRPRRSGTIIPLVAFMLSRQLTPATCLAKIGRPNSTRRRASAAHRPTELRFRSSHYMEGVAGRHTEPQITISGCPKAHPESQSLPPWLALPRGHLMEAKLEALQVAMRDNGLFTENESRKLFQAIEEASGGDRNKAAGAAEFCLSLVEMGLNALVAAAFHYCSCLSARERLLVPSATTTTAQTFMAPSSAMESYGSHAKAIAKDAARLKQLEWVAAAVTNDGRAGGRVHPDSVDAENLRQLFLSEAKDWRALAIRSAACLFRLRGILLDKKYRTTLTPDSMRCSREALHIFAPLASQMGMHRLKNELEGAAFRILYRRQFETLNKLAHEVRAKPQDSVSKRESVPSSSDTAIDIGDSMREIMSEVQRDMKLMLEQDEEFSAAVDSFSVTARVKEPYSMWKKMLHNKYSHILQVPDAIAFRIVLEAKKMSPDEAREVTSARERALCYYAQKLCLRKWKPLSGNPRFRDYIGNPKPNGYQSLHYTASTEWAGEEWSMEIQVRSGQMHKVAEYGLASHFEYKSKKRGNNRKTSGGEVSMTFRDEERSDHSSDAYMRRVKNWHWQQHAGVAQQWRPRDYHPQRQKRQPAVDASPASFEPLVLSDIWQNRVRADRIRARTQHLEPYIQALTAAQSDLARECVFVFLTRQHSKPSLPSKQDRCFGASSSQGKVMVLPAGACVVDALREGGKILGGLDNTSSLGNYQMPSLPLVEVNGSAAPLTEKLQNGDVLTVPVKSSVPSLSF